MRKDIVTRKSEIKNWISENRPKAWIAKELDCKIDTLDSYLKKWGIFYKGNIGGKGYKKSPIRKTAVEYLNSNGVIKTPKLRMKLIQDGIKENKCESCGINEWMGKKILLELHHKDGDRYNNQLNNLQILCPNCHSLTPNHSRKKIAPMV